MIKAPHLRAATAQVPIIRKIRVIKPPGLTITRKNAGILLLIKAPHLRAVAAKVHDHT